MRFSRRNIWTLQHKRVFDTLAISEPPVKCLLVSDLEVNDFQVCGQRFSKPLWFGVQLLTVVVFMMQVGEMLQIYFLCFDQILEFCHGETWALWEDTYTMEAGLIIQLFAETLPVVLSYKLETQLKKHRFSLNWCMFHLIYTYYIHTAHPWLLKRFVYYTLSMLSFDYTTNCYSAQTFFHTPGVSGCYDFLCSCTTHCYPWIWFQSLVET